MNCLGFLVGLIRQEFFQSAIQVVTETPGLKDTRDCGFFQVKSPVSRLG